MNKDEESRYDARLALVVRGLDPEGWNIYINGVLTFEAVTRKAADNFLKVHRAGPRVGKLVQVCLACKPPPAKRQGWRRQALPRPHPKRWPSVTEVERTEIIAELTAKPKYYRDNFAVVTYEELVA